MHETNPIFKNNLKNIEGVKVPVMLIGDSAFALSSVVMKPYPFNLNAPITEQNFNYALSKCRRVVENAFGHLKARFRKIGKGLEVQPASAPIIIKACCFLHNFCNESNDLVYHSWEEELKKMQQLNKKRQPENTTISGNNDSSANAIRSAIAKTLSKKKKFTSVLLFILL